MNYKTIDTFLQLGLANAKTFLLFEIKLRHDLRKKYLHQKDFETIYEIRNFRNKNRLDFANDEFKHFEPLGVVE